MNYYDLLEVSPRASPEVIRAAYKSLMQRHHPDKRPAGEMANDHAALIVRAYEVLSDATARAAYDAQLRRQAGAAGATPGAGAARPYAAYGHVPGAVTRGGYAWLLAMVILLAVGSWYLLRDSRRPTAPVVQAQPRPVGLPAVANPDASAGVAAAPVAPVATASPGAEPPAARPQTVKVSLLVSDLQVLLVRHDPDGEEGDDHTPRTLSIPALTVEVGSMDAEGFAGYLERDRELLVLELADRLGHRVRYRRLQTGGDRYLARVIGEILREITGARGLYMPPETAMPGVPSAPDADRHGVVAVTLPASFSVW